MSEVAPQIEESWKEALRDEFEASYFMMLKEFLKEDKKTGIIYPPGPKIFAAFNHTPLTAVKVVILGQDPYHGSGQANGLSFSVNDGVKLPPSLVNIYKELKSDLGIPISESGNLTKWADQGVLLLNATLTVQDSKPGSHQGKGWETFTDNVIRTVSDLRAGVVFLLWGKYAREKKVLVDEDKHMVLEAPHPSPLSANRGFFGCRHFSKTNTYLEENGLGSIDWNPAEN